MNIFKNRSFLVEAFAILSVLVSIFVSSRALFHSGFFRTIDDVSTVRIVEMKNELLRDRLLDNFPVRWTGELAHGLGYPLFLFYAPLPYYAGASAMIFLGMSGIVATKLVYVFPLLIGGILFYVASRQKLSPFSVAISSILFSFFPYRGYNVYERGGIGESWAICFIPLAFLGLFLLQKNKKLGITIFSLGTFLVLISHNLVAMQFLALIFAYGLLFHLKNIRYWLSTLLGIGMSSFYLFPMVFYLNSVRVLTTSPNTGKILESLEPISSILKLSFPYTVGTRYSAIFSYLLVLSIFLVIKNRSKIASKAKMQIYFWVGTSLVLLFLLTKQSYLLWNASLSITQILQFSWRILSLLSFTLPMAIGNVLNISKLKSVRILTVGLTFISVLYLLPAFKPTSYTTFYEYHAAESGPCATTTWENEYLPKAVEDCVTSPRSFIENEGAETMITESSPNYLSAESNSELSKDIQVNKYLFPGWSTRVDGELVQLNLSKLASGTFSFLLPPGKHKFEIKYSKTFVMMLADTITIGSIVLFLYNSFGIFLVSKKLSHEQ